MNWVTPGTGILLGAIVIPLLLLLYFLRLRRQTLRISSTMLWERAIEDLHANSPFQRLKPSVLLLLQLLALLLVVIAIMQPQIEGGSPEKGTHVIMIDRSGSMTAKNSHGTTRLDEAKEKAINLVNQIHGGGLFSSHGGETMIIAFSDHAEVVSPFTDSKQQLIRAINSIRPSHGDSKISDALILARAYTTTVDPEKDGLLASESAKLELFSDGLVSDLKNQALQRGESLQYHMIGSEDVNIGITTIDAKRPTESSEEVQIFISLINTSLQVESVDIELRINAVPVGVQEVTIPAQQGDVPGSASLVFVPFAMPQSGVVTAALLRNDSLEMDNQASLVIPPAKELRILLAEQGAPIFQSVLEGMALAELKVVQKDTLEEMLLSGESTSYDVVVLRDIHVESMPRGNYFIFGDPPPLEPFSTHVDGEAQIMLVATEEHPVMRFVRYEEIVVTHGSEIVVDDSVEILLEGSHWPAVMAFRGNGVQLLYVAFDPMDSNWPYLRSFPFFIFNGVQYLGHYGDQLATNARIVGQTIVETVQAVDSVQMREPDGELHTIQVDENSNVSWGPIRLSGLHTISTKDAVLSTSAIKSPSVESIISPVEQIEIGASKVSTTRSGGSSFIQLWPWALGSVLLVLLIEWWVYQKKVSAPISHYWASPQIHRRRLR